jgi:hypothetical protein
MRKTQFLAVFWTLILAIPITALALTATAYLTDNLTQISSMIALALGGTLVKARDLLFEAELLGLIAGQALILVILLVTYLTRTKEVTKES